MANTNGVNPGIINNYTIKPRNLTQYTAFRGVTDFTQIGQFNPFETGYSFLSVISMPKFIDKLAEKDDGIKLLRNSFKHILEYEFRGLQGLPNIEGQSGTLSDGINEVQYINQVRMDTSIQVSMNVIEKSGSTITKFSEYYLTGIKDRMTQAKTYHGLIENNLLEPGLENEVFTLLYYVTDNTMRRLERAVLLCNCQLTTAELGSLYNSEKGTIDNVQFSINFNAFPVYGTEVDKAAKTLLEDIVGTVATYELDGNKWATRFTPNTNPVMAEGADDGYGEKFHGAVLDSNNYEYGILTDDSDRNSAAGNNGNILPDARNKANERNSSY